MIINVTRFSYLSVTPVLMGLPSSSLLPESSCSWPTFSTLCSNCSWCKLLRYQGRAILPPYLYFKDGKLTVFESCGICLLSVASTMMIIVDLIILIWVRDYTTQCTSLHYTHYCRALLWCLVPGLAGPLTMQSILLSQIYTTTVTTHQ